MRTSGPMTPRLLIHPRPATELEAKFSMPFCAAAAIVFGHPTIDTFEYDEEVRFWHVGKPLLSYTQRTWHPVKGFAMHAEMGFWRIQPEGRVEIVLAQ